MNSRALAAFAALAEASAPKTCTASKLWAPAGIENAREVDDREGPLANRGERGWIAHIGLHRHDLARCAERLHMAREIRPPAGDADAMPRLARACVTCRPTKPDPPIRVTIFSEFSAVTKPHPVVSRVRAAFSPRGPRLQRALH